MILEQNKKQKQKLKQSEGLLKTLKTKIVPFTFLGFNIRKMQLMLRDASMFQP